MTMETESLTGRSSGSRVLPWLVAAGALVVYLVTINPWVSLANLPQVGRVAGYTWQPELLSPAYYVATLPLQLLPTKWVPLGLNLFSALCAVLTLAQLARSVVLLPHDRTHEQREREKSDHSLLSIPSAWVPPVVAALVCGLQLTFWENATNGTIEMFDLLLFAWVIRALLEYRVDGRDSWLYRAALVYGIGMTNNFAMWGFFPVFIIALVWIRGMSFFNPRFLGRMALFGLIGLSLYLLLPLIASLSKSEPVNFWQAVKLNLSLQKNILIFYPKLPTRGLENMDWVVMVVVCILPILLFSIRWPSYFGDTSQIGIWLATVIFHVMFGLYLCICIWCLFDAPFSPRFRGYSIPFLTFYYLAALSVGYFIGYFLLVFGAKPARGRSPGGITRLVKGGILTLAIVIAMIAPLGLALKNLPKIRTNNGPIMRSYADALAAGLPKSGVLLSDDTRRLFMMQAWLALVGREKDFLPLDTHLDGQNRGPLAWPAYHRYLHRTYPAQWAGVSDPKRDQMYGMQEMIGLLTKLAGRFELCYLHPSFGNYFEYFYSEPHGLACRLKRYGAETLLPPKLTPELVAANEAFWSEIADKHFKPILKETQPRAPGEKKTFLERIFKAARLRPEPNAQTVTVGAFYSRVLNEWAVEIQKYGDLEKAAAHFEMAGQLNPDNLVAQINLEYNQNLRAGKQAPIQLPKSIEDRFGKYRSWDQVLAENGPYDEPGFCYAQGFTFVRCNLYRQAAQPFDRVRTFSPNDLPSRMWLANLNLMARRPGDTLEIARELREHPDRFPLNRTNRIELVSLEARAHFARNEPDTAVKLLEAAIAESPNDEQLLTSATTAYFENGRYANALAVVDRHAKIAPDDPRVLIRKAALSMQLNAPADAIEPLSRALTLSPDDQTARFYRAIAYLRSDQLDAAQKDYETLQPVFPNAYQIFFGLGEISYRRKDTNAAINYYEAYLTNSVPADEAKLVNERLKELKGQSP